MHDADNDQDNQWTYAPILCAALLIAGVCAGVVRAVTHSQCGPADPNKASPWPRLSVRWTVRITSWGSFVFSVLGLLGAAHRFIHTWMEPDHELPLVLLCLTITAYVLLCSSLLFAFIGLRYQERNEQVHSAVRQSATAALLAGLALGIACEVLCDAGEPEDQVPVTLRHGYAMLGGASGLFLLGLVAAKADGDEENEKRAKSAKNSCEGSHRPVAPHEKDEEQPPPVSIRHDSVDFQNHFVGGAEDSLRTNRLSLAREPNWESLFHASSSVLPNIPRSGGSLTEPLMAMPPSPAAWRQLPQSGSGDSRLARQAQGSSAWLGCGKGPLGTSPAPALLPVLAT